MNVHHLELFYYVAKHGGISPAVRRMPYGIQQPAVSGQVLQLEESLGVKLFNRRPFALTPPGERLFAFISPFFANVAEVGAELRGEANSRLRLAANASALRDHVPAVLRRLQQRYPDIRLTLHEADQAEAESLLQRQEIDLAITELDAKPAPGLQAATLLRLPLVLLVPPGCPFEEAEAFWRGGADPVPHPLISVSERAILTKLFATELRRRGHRWPVSLQVNSLSLIETYAAEGYGIGLVPAVPRNRPLPPGLRQLPLHGFAPIVIAALWQGKLPSLPAAFLQVAKQRVAELEGAGTGPASPAAPAGDGAAAGTAAAPSPAGATPLRARRRKRV